VRDAHGDRGRTPGDPAALCRDWDLGPCGRLAKAAASVVGTALGSDAGIQSYEQTLDVMLRGRR
jgi:hypothetical protein